MREAAPGPVAVGSQRRDNYVKRNGERIRGRGLAPLLGEIRVLRGMR